MRTEHARRFFFSRATALWNRALAGVRGGGSLGGAVSEESEGLASAAELNVSVTSRAN